jgi:hypothetical protein
MRGREAQPVDVVHLSAFRRVRAQPDGEVLRPVWRGPSTSSGQASARAYLAHPLLGPRYRQCVAAVRAQLDAGNSLEAIFGKFDAMKFRSSAEIIVAALAHTSSIRAHADCRHTDLVGEVRC